MPNTVYVGANRKIIAFSPGFVPRGEGLNAVLNGRIRTEPVKPDPASLREFANSGTVLLMAEPSKMQGFDDHKPKFPPSYEVHIAPSTTLGTMSTSAPDYWSVGGFDLKSIVAQAYGVEETHADFRDALKEKFNLKIASEDETLDVYVVTAPYGPGPELHPAEDSMGGSINSSSDLVLSERQAAYARGHESRNGPAESIKGHYRRQHLGIQRHY